MQAYSLLSVVIKIYSDPIFLFNQVARYLPAVDAVIRSFGCAELEGAFPHHCAVERKPAGLGLCYTSVRKLRTIGKQFSFRRKKPAIEAGFRNKSYLNLINQTT